MESLLQLLINGIMLGGIYGLISMGLTLTFGVMKIVNFAHGEFLMLGMYGAFWLYHLLGIQPYLAILIMIPVMFAFGLVIQRGLIQKLIDASGITQIFVTVGLSMALQNGVLYLWSADYRGVKIASATSSITIGNLSFSISRLIVFTATVAVVAFLLFFLKKTSLGKAMRATSQNWRAAWLMGVNVRKIYLIAFAMGSALVGLAGCMIIPIYSVYPSVGINFVLITFVVVVLGGMGNILGAFLAGIIVGLVETVSGFILAPSLGPMVVFILFVLILLFRPSGLFGNTRI
ncbi:MAG: branched-chain amino acid ABC transporter permease [Syntrophobacter sp.]